MRSVKIHEAKTQLSRLLVAVEAGEEITPMRGNFRWPNWCRSPDSKKRRVYRVVSIT